MMKRTLLTILTFTIIGILFFATPAYAATVTPKATLSAVADAEIEREKQITKELSLNMPDQTEDPNYPVTFVDPGKQGVDITVDEKTTTKAPSPFLLPNLAIGEHKIIFKFKTKDGVVRVLTKKLLLTPKAPQFDQTLKTEVVRPNSVTLKGTALPQATIMIVINSDSTYKIMATSDGKWEFIVPSPKEGVNNVLAFAIKSGIVSTASKTFTVVYKLNASDAVAATTGTSKENQIVTFAKTVLNNIDANRREQPTIFYGVIGAAVVGILIVIDFRLRKRAAKNRDEKTIAALFGTLQKDGGTIVDAIQSVTDSVMKKKTKAEPETKPSPPAKIKKAFAELKQELAEPEEIVEETKTTKKEEPAKKTIAQQVKAVEQKVNVVKAKAKAAIESKPRQEKKVAPIPKSEPLVAVPDTEEEIADETEEPEKKVLTKEEFLKQFQKEPGKDE